MLTQGRWAAFRNAFPAIMIGETDVPAGRWTEIVGNRESFAYEIGRALAITPPRTGPLGIVTLDPHIAGMVNQLVRFTE